jgi:DNA (cytosine-5)-methyltransferase 1
MKATRILNLYACLGGNRYKWNEVSNNIEVVAVELDRELAKLYQERFPNDTVIVTDAHQYLLENYMKFDFIWSSPPCPTHSRARFWGLGANGKNPVYPDMKLYQEIIFLQHHYKGKYCVENVISYYEPMLTPQKRGRHYYWTNFMLPNVLSERKCKISEGKNEVENLCIFHDYDFTKYKGEQRTDKIARNLVDYEAGKTILETAMNIQRKTNTKQVSLFDA